MVRAHEAPLRQHLHGWSYTAGCVATFVSIAATMFALRAGGEAIGWGFQLQSPVVVGSLAYLFFVMALLMYGHFQWPNQLSGIGQQLTEGNKLPSSFFTGVLATVVASPCTAPFMGSALGYAMTLPTTLGLLVFAALGFGMALPFLLLSYFPQLGQRLPKPGAWMETFKQLLAFPLLLTAIWLAWIFSRQTSSDQTSLLLCGALALSFALWLSQRLNHNLKVRGLRALLIVSSLAAALYPLGNTTTHKLSSDSRTVDWQAYTDQRLAELRADSTPVFINLTADWCITCLANEKLVLSHDVVKQAFTAAGITKLKGDWTNYNPEITKLLAQHGRNGVPLYLLYPADNQQQPQILPQILRKADLLDTIASQTLKNTLEVSNFGGI
jgi:thiol:disulfide interchange protein DsbD